MINTVCFWLKNSRLFSLPMSIFSWLVIFVYSLQFGGNILNGVVALIGISFAQLATNLFDDYVDYKKLTDNSQKCKCAYIKEGMATLSDVLKVVIVYLTISLLTGLFLFLRCGIEVVWLALIGGIIALLYAKLSQKGFSEIAVGITFGPLLFEGVHFVMTGNFSLSAFVMSLSVVMFTIGLMYVHTLLDYEGDLSSHKKTLVCRLASKNVAINGVFVVYGIGYLFALVFVLFTNNYFILASLLLIPLVFDLHKSLKSFKCGDDVKEFYFRLLKARNLMVYFSVIFIVSIILKSTIFSI